MSPPEGPVGAGDVADSARHYIDAHSLELIPTIPRTKKPARKTGTAHAEWAVTSSTEVDQWWRSDRRGIAVSGMRNRLAALDVDGREGFGKWWQLEKANGALPITWGLSSNRPEGDRVTFIYRWPGLIEVATSNKVDGCRKLELKSASSIFLLPPSRHPEGRTYSWLPGVSCCEVELAVLPTWMATLEAAA